MIPISEPKKKDATARELIPGLEFAVNLLQVWIDMSHKYEQVHAEQDYRILMKAFERELNTANSSIFDEDTEEHYFMDSLCAHCPLRVKKT